MCADGLALSGRGVWSTPVWAGSVAYPCLGGEHGLPLSGGGSMAYPCLGGEHGLPLPGGESMAYPWLGGEQSLPLPGRGARPFILVCYITSCGPRTYSSICDVVTLKHGLFKMYRYRYVYT